MSPTDILRNEHRVIEQMLDCLEKIAAEARTRGHLEEDTACDAIAFFRTFADRCHHGKEESHLFPAFEAKGFRRDGGPTGVMLREHEQGREYTRKMNSAVKAAAAGDAKAIGLFCRNAQSYLDLLREHIGKEDQCLFGMAEQALSPADQTRLLEEFERVESEHMGEGTHQQYIDLANRLADRYGVAKPKTANAGHHCGCEHRT